MSLVIWVLPEDCDPPHPWHDRCLIVFAPDREAWYTLTVVAPDSAEGWQKLEERAVRFIAGCL